MIDLVRASDSELESDSDRLTDLCESIASVMIIVSAMFCVTDFEIASEIGIKSDSDRIMIACVCIASVMVIVSASL